MRIGITVLALVVLLLASRAQGAGGAAASCFPASDFGLPSSSEVRGDLDGDGRPDTASTRVRWRGPSLCRASLVVETRKRTYVRRIGAETGALIAPPPVAALVPLDRRAGLEVAVEVWRGSSTGFLELFGIRRGGLVRLDEAPFPYAGSLVHRAGIDCAKTRGALLVASTATAERGRYTVERRFYSVRQAHLEERPRLRERYRVHFDELEQRFAEFVQIPFPRCAAVRSG